MINVKPLKVERESGSVLVSADEPVRIEIGTHPTTPGVIVYVYRGVEIDTEQEPDAVYDSLGQAPDDNVEITVTNGGSQ